MLEIKFKKRRVIASLIFGCLWLALFFSHVIFGEGLASIFSFYSLLAVAYLGQYAYERTKPYIQISEHSIVKNALFNTKRINIEDIIAITQRFGDFEISSKNKKILVTKGMMNEQGYESLVERLNQIKAERVI